MQSFYCNYYCISIPEYDTDLIPDSHLRASLEVDSTTGRYLHPDISQHGQKGKNKGEHDRGP